MDIKKDIAFVRYDKKNSHIEFIIKSELRSGGQPQCSKNGKNSTIKFAQFCFSHDILQLGSKKIDWYDFLL